MATQSGKRGRFVFEKKKKKQTFYTDVLSFLRLITYKNQKRDKKFSSQRGGVSA